MGWEGCGPSRCESDGGYAYLLVSRTENHPAALAPLLTSDEEGKGALGEAEQQLALHRFSIAASVATARGAARLVNLRIASIPLIPHLVAAIRCAEKYRRLSLSIPPHHVPSKDLTLGAAIRASCAILRLGR